MKIISVLDRLEKNTLNFNGKVLFKNQALKGDFVGVIYYDLDKEQIKLKQFIGFCLKFRSKGINSKVRVRTYIKRIYIEQEFFLYGKTCIDAGVIRKKK